MQCCVPFCKTTTEIVSGSEGITFHEFPSEVQVRAAWFRALGKQDSHLADTAVVCSQHFLNEDIYTTESGSRNIRTGAIPSMVQVCMICLDTGSKLYLMSKYKLDEAYQHLVGHPLCDQGNLKQTLCVQCAQRLVNFNKFRDKSLRARSLMMELVEQHDLITIQHIKSISRVKHKLKSDIVRTVLGPDQFDVYIAHSDTDIKTELDATVEAVAMEHDKSDSMSVDADQSRHMAVTSAGSDADSCNGAFAYKEEYLSDDSDRSEVKQMRDPSVATSSLCEITVETSTPIKQEVTFACTTCLKEFADEDMYIHHTLMHTEDIGNLDDDSVAGCSLSSVAALAWTLKTDQERNVHPTEGTAHVETIAALAWTLKTDQERNAHPTEGTADVETIAPLPAGLATNHENEVHPTETNEELNILVLENNGSSNSHLVQHMRSHTGEKHFVCELCDYKITENSSLVKHMKTHTREKHFVCKFCDFKCTKNRYLVQHIRNHTGEKSFVCTLCDYKCAYKSRLLRHMRSHTGEKPFVCKLCDYKCTQNSNLVTHMRTHTGEKPFVCKLCDFKCSIKINLVRHMRTHTA